MKKLMFWGKRKILLLIVLSTLFLIQLGHIINAEGSITEPYIKLSSSQEIYVANNDQGYSLHGEIGNYRNSNVNKIIWSTTELTEPTSENAIEWLENNKDNSIDVYGSQFNINFNQAEISPGTTWKIYPIQVSYQIIESDSTESSEEESSEAENIVSYYTIVNLYEPQEITFIEDTSPPEVSIDVNVNNLFFYNQSTLSVKVTGTDEELGANAIIAYLTIIDRNNQEANEFQKMELVADSTQMNGNTITCQYTLEFKPNQYEYIFSAVAYNRNTTNNASKEEYWPDSSVGIVYDYEKPEIDIEPVEEIEFKKDDIYYHNMHQSFEISIEDYISGIQSYSIKINGTLIENEYDTDEKIEMTDSQHLSCIINTAQVSESTDNKYRIEVTSVDNVGNTETEYVDLQIDQIPPQIESIVYNSDSDENISLSEQGMIYEYFGTEKTYITIKAVDDTYGIGVKCIEYYIVDDQGDKVESDIIDVDQNGEITVEISPELKGFVYAKAYDYLGNVLKSYMTTGGFILETQEAHDEQEHIFFTLESTDKKDAQGNPLFADSTSVEIVVCDDYSGISKVEWSINAPNNVENNKTESLVINAEEELSDSAWNISETDKNLITQVKTTLDIVHNSNNIVVRVKLTDNAGNISEKEIALSIDTTKPDIDIIFNEINPDTVYTNIYQVARTATIVVRERNFSAALINTNIVNTLHTVPTMSNWTESRDISNPDNTTYTATVTFSQDGDYTFSMSGTDMAGNQATADNVPAFTIDQTAPVITVSYSHQSVHNQNYYSNGRLVTITVNERNFAPERISLRSSSDNSDVNVQMPVIGTWTQQGDTYTSTVLLSDDGIYDFILDGTDKAGNNAMRYESGTFIIDTTFPTIRFDGVEDMSANNGDVAPIIYISDVNYNANTLSIKLAGANSGPIELQGWYTLSQDKKTVTFSDFPRQQSIDDLYTLEVAVEDMAGNITESSITFSVNRFGSVYIFNNELKEISSRYVKSVSDISLTEVNVDALLDDTIQLVLTVNGVPRTLHEGVDYSIENAGDTSSWRYYVYQLEDELFENDGTYILTVYSVDRAGNINQNTQENKEAEIQFGVDTTAPVILPINIEADMVYDTVSYRANVSIKDNLVLEQVKVYLNGKELTVTEENENYYFDIPESNERQNIRIVALDAAGNEEEYSIENILVTTNLFVRWYNNKPLFWISLIIGGGIIGVIIFLLMNKKDKES